LRLYSENDTQFDAAGNLDAGVDKHGDWKWFSDLHNPANGP
jgi:hypothetical protein